MKLVDVYYGSAVGHRKLLKFNPNEGWEVQTVVPKPPPLAEEIFVNEITKNGKSETPNHH